MEANLLRDILLIFGLAAIILWGCQKIRLPSLVGLIAIGALFGPHALGWVSNQEAVQLLAEIGVALLLFSVGVELSLQRFLLGWRQILFGGGIQVALVMLVALATSQLLGRSLSEGLFLGFLLSLSSTAIVLNLLQERSAINSPHGKLAVSILVFQDLAVLPMMLLIPVLAGGVEEIAASYWTTFGKSAAILISVVVAGHWIVPRILDRAARARNLKIFLLLVLFFCFSIAWLSYEIGLSFALGAFLAGLIISESEYKHHAVSHLLPFQEVFSSFFFVSVGMLLNLYFLVDHLLLVTLAVVGVMALKIGASAVTALLLSLPLRTAICVGFALCQVGEFSFILASAGMQQGLSDAFSYQLFLATSLITMAVTPLTILLGPHAASAMLRLPLPERIKTGLRPVKPSSEEELTNHILVIGYGVNGHNLVYCLGATNIPYVVIDLDPRLVTAERRKGEHILFGDASHASVLHQARIDRARAVAVMVSDPTAALQITTSVRQCNSEIYIVARTWRIQEIDRLLRMGANDVVADEFESSLEILTRLSARCDIGDAQTDRILKKLREDQYERLQQVRSQDAIR